MINLWYLIWELPQNFVGALIIGFIRLTQKDSRYTSDRILVCRKFFDASVTLGEFIIMQEDFYTSETIRHERGHRIQSRMLGPLYFIVIGIPSFFEALKSKILRKKGVSDKAISEWYHSIWPESWADRLGGVK